MEPRTTNRDVIVVGGGHNGLVCALLLARKGFAVSVLEQKQSVGGAAKTERPFRRAPNLGISSGAYLLGLMPPELHDELGLDLPLLRRDPHYFLPTTGERYLLLGSDGAAMERQFREFFSERDWKANQALNEEIGKIRDDLHPAWLMEPLSLEETAERFIRKELRQRFVALCRGTAAAYLERFGFKSDLLKAMYAVTDGFSGLDGGYDTPGTGMNFLIHNMCRLPKASGTWMIVQGGMGVITQRLAELARQAGVQIETDAEVSRIETQAGAASGVTLKDGRSLAAKVVISNADPFRTQALIGKERLPAAYNARLEELKCDGTTMKVNLALKGLPKFSCLEGDRGQYGPTIHLLPDEDVVLSELRRAYADAKAGRLPEFPSIEWYVHTLVDPSLKDSEGHHNSALFVEWVPYELKGTTWEEEEGAYVQKLLAICDRFAPGTSDLVVDTFTLTPPKIEQHFGITRGHIHHVDNKFGFDERLPYATPIGGLYFCSAGCHPAGSVIGAAGHNAAVRVAKDLGWGLGAR